MNITTDIHTYFIKVYRKLCSDVFTVIFLSLLITTLSFSYGFAQMETSAPESLELRLATIEQQYDSQVIGILSNYFERKKFFVDINIDAEIVNDTYRTTQNQVVRGRGQDVLMPGLPFLPEENIQQDQTESETRQTVVNESTVQRLKVLQVRINVYADSSFSQQEVDFMRLIAGIAGKINEARGDVVNVSLIDMPDFGFENFSPPPLTIQPEPETLLGSINDYVPGFVLVILIGLTLLIGRFTNKPVQPATSLREQRETFKNDQNYNLNDSILDESGREKEAESQSQITQQPDKQSDFDFITEQFLKNSKDVALLFELWLDENPESGAKKAAEVVNVIDKHLIKSLKGDLDTEKYQLIADEVEAMPPLELQKKSEVAAEFKAKIQKGSNPKSETKKHTQLGLFQFLDHLKDYQVVQLLIGEDRATSALIIDYLPDHKEADILEKLDKDRTTEIMLGMTDLHNLSYKDHKEISSRLFSKAMDILEIEKELQQGSENVLRVLEKLPLKDQSKYVEQLKATGSPVGRLIEKKFITIDEIPKLEHSVLKNAIDHLPTETILDALVGLEQESIEKILSIRPKREQRLLKMELQLSGIEETDETDKAKLKLMSSIRKAINKSKQF